MISMPQVVRTAFSDQLRLRALPTELRSQLDAMHVSQNRSRFNPDAPEHTNNCALASIVMGLRYLGRELQPGGSAQEQVEHAAMLATGTRTPIASNFTQRAKIFDAVGIQPRATADIDELLAPGRDRVVVLSGHAGAQDTWYGRYSADELRQDGHHAITAVRPGNGEHGWFVHDPNSNIGTFPVDESELRNFFAGAHGIPGFDGSDVDVTSLILR